MIIYFLIAVVFFNTQQQVSVYLIGDSTMSEKDISAYPEHGWGMPFSYFFDQTVKVENHARNGRSTRSFREEGRWDVVEQKLQAGDYVFIQFGHNDEVQTKKSSTKPEEFGTNLVNFVHETRKKAAIPVLLTPVARRRFDEEGKIVSTHDKYSAIVREVAAEEDVFLIDHDLMSQNLLQEMGVENSILLFNHLEAGEHPNYPNGKSDNTHFNELGARKMAQFVLSTIKESDLGLKEKIYKPGK